MRATSGGHTQDETKADSEAQAQVAALERKNAMAVLAAGHLATGHSATIGCYIISNE